jgi:hypothetical protein
MGDMNVAYINPRIITWAMAQHKLVPEQLATEAVTADKIRAWERGEPISEDQAEFLANKLQIPYLVLFLADPPQPDPVPIPDLRTRSGKPVVEPSREFIRVINDALMRQDWFREHKLRLGKQKLALVGRFTTKDSVADVAANMRLVLGVNTDFRQQCRSWEQFLRKLMKKVESAGILGMRSGVVGHSTHKRLDAEEFQGFAISDPFAPLVFVNDTDARAAQIFTLAHELAHIWIGKTAESMSTRKVVTMRAIVQDSLMEQMRGSSLRRQSTTAPLSRGKNPHPCRTSLRFPTCVSISASKSLLSQT